MSMSFFFTWICFRNRGKEQFTRRGIHMDSPMIREHNTHHLKAPAGSDSVKSSNFFIQHPPNAQGEKRRGRPLGCPARLPRAAPVSKSQPICTSSRVSPKSHANKLLAFWSRTPRRLGFGCPGTWNTQTSIYSPCQQIKVKQVGSFSGNMFFSTHPPHDPLHIRYITLLHFDFPVLAPLRCAPHVPRGA